MAAYALLFLSLSYFFLIRPLRKEFSLARNRRMQEDYYLFQLKQVRKMYPVLQNLCYEEIHEQFDVREAYRSKR